MTARDLLAAVRGGRLRSLRRSRRRGAADAAPPLVLTGTQATYSLTVALTAGTPIRVQNVPADGRQLGLLKDYIQRRTDTLAPTFSEATAVVTLTNALAGDPLYRFARDANIRIVDIEAAVPWSLDVPGVALAETPASSVAWGDDTDVAESAVAPYFWLSVSNSIRMGDIIAHDLEALFPDSADAISANLETLKRSLLELRGDYQDRLIESGADVVFALTSDFVYLTNDMGLYVDGYFVKQDVRWTDADLAALDEAPARQRHQSRAPQVAAERGDSERRACRGRGARRSRRRRSRRRRRAHARGRRIAANPAQEPRGDRRCG